MADEARERIWTYEEAKVKCSEKYSCFVEIKTQEHMSLSPYYIGRIKQGIVEQIELSIQRWKYVEKYTGIIVAYSNIKLLQRSAEIYDESPLLHFDISVNYILFKPEIGKKLVGVVNRTSATHVGCLVHGKFNASLFKPRTGQNGWVGSNLEIGTEFVFRVCDLRTVAGVLSIAGQIKEKDMKYCKHPGDLKQTKGHMLSLDQSEKRVEECSEDLSTPKNDDSETNIGKKTNLVHKKNKKRKNPSVEEQNHSSISTSALKTKKNNSPVHKRKMKKL